jgi:biopolymer transport protein ExbD
MRLSGEPGIRLPRGRRLRSLDDALLPLINIVFLLMVFFLFVGRLGGSLAPEQAPTSQGARGPLLSAAPQRLELLPDGRLQIGAERFAETELAARIAAWQGLPVDLRSGAEAPAERVLRVLAVLRGAGVGEVRLLTVRSRGAG